MSTEVALHPAVALTQQLVRLDTRNPPGAEAPAIDLLEARLSAAGFSTTVVPYLNDPSRRHVVARLSGKGSRPGVLFSGHVDVVPPGDNPWSFSPFCGELQDGRVLGRGACDMKSGVAALVIAAEQIARMKVDLEGDLVVALTADEERNCLGAEQLVKEPLFDGLGYALVAEPTSLELVIAEKGALWVDVSFLGKTAHGSMPQSGANAISAAAEFMVRWESRYDALSATHPFLGRATLNPGVIRGGVKVNVVADRCTIELDMRTVPPMAHTDLVADIRALAAGIADSRAGISFTMALASDRPSVFCDPESGLARALSASFRALDGRNRVCGGVPYCTEACIWTPSLGVESVICGPGRPDMAHQPDEYVDAAEIVVATDAFRAAALELLSAGPTL